MARATLYESDKLHNRPTGELEVQPDRIVFRSDEGERHDMPLEGLGCRTGGIESRVVFFSHPARPGIEIVTEDFSVLQSDALARHPDAQAALASSKGHERRFVFFQIFVILFVVLGVLAGGWFLLRIAFWAFEVLFG